MADCLVLMSFRKELDSHFLLIKECGERLGLTVYRVDSHRFSGNIVEAIAKALSDADLIVADLTGNNPNVMYELAIAHSLGKKVLIVTNDRNAIPFDVATYRAEIIDPDSPEHREELFRAMKDLGSSIHVTGPLGGQLIYGQNLAARRVGAFGVDLGPFVVCFFALAYLLGWGRALSDELVISDRYRMVSKHPIGKIDDVPLFPAIAIPVETKSGFECPQDNLDCLRHLLPSTTKILIVGWRATEQHFLRILKETLPIDVPVFIVAENKAAADEVFDHIVRAGIRISGVIAERGFTEVVVQREAEQFLRS